jgi:hypothetical protein
MNIPDNTPGFLDLAFEASKGLLALSPILAPAGYWLIKALVGRSLKRELAEHEMNLKEVLEEHKADLIFRNRVQDRLQIKQASLIEEIYALVGSAERTAGRFLSPIQTDDKTNRERYNEFVDVGKELALIYNEKDIFFEDALNQEIKDFLGLVTRTTDALLFEFQVEEDGSKTGRKIQVWRDSAKELSTGAPIIRKQLRAQFQRLLGVTSPT